ncbi:hypothetical protein QJ854_gp544 [Moumouvirus goulette]|uniref:Uncharacterized protein n=1 Tax=Moumouvirus goulette TaxID=1247379 RepID=M1PGU1_9VIRU|nr:hypothetical protein QJ854_gp544 [Moumouvirus goulette]AGF85238.1 hypothetical protein glt_00429 [Moumouvirus goulette]
MQFQPMGGFPPIIRNKKNNIDDNILETRGFTTTNIVSIGDIINNKKKQDLYFAFGSDEEQGYDPTVMNMIYTEPNNYTSINSSI